MNIEPFGYFRALPCGWEDCAETDEGARPLYDQEAIDALTAQLEQARAECNEQARENGMGTERELALMAERDKLRAEVEGLRKPLTPEHVWQLWAQECKVERPTVDLVVAFARAIEKAHGIEPAKEQQ